MRFSLKSVLRTFHFFLSLVVVSSAAWSTTDEASRGAADSLSRRLREFRSEGHYDEALVVARDLLETLGQNPKAKAWRIDDAEMTIATLERITDLSEEEREPLAQAERLTRQIVEHMRQGEYAAATELTEQQLEIRRRIMGPDDPMVAASLVHLAMLSKDGGRYAEAESLLRQALSIEEGVISGDHPKVASRLNDLGLLTKTQGRYAEAESLLRRALDIRERAYGQMHLAVAASLNNLAVLLQDQGRYAEGESFIRRALDIRLAALGPEDPKVARCLTNLAALHLHQGRYAEAEPLLKRALTIKQTVYGMEHRELISTLKDLAWLYQDQGNVGKAEEHYRRARSIAQSVLGPEHPRVAACLVDLAKLRKKSRDLGEAESVAKSALAIQENALGPGHPRVATTLNLLADVYRIQGRYAEAQQHCQRALGIWEEAHGPKHPKVAACRSNLALIYMDQGRFAEAGGLLRGVLAMDRVLLGEEHPHLPWFLSRLAECLLAQNKREKAEEHLKEATAIFETARLRVGTGFERARFQVSPYWQLAATELELGKDNEAWQAAERALGRALADLLIASGKRSLNPSEALREDSLKRTLGQLESQLTARWEASRADTSAAAKKHFEEARRCLLDVEAAWGTFQHEIASKYPITEGRSFALERIQATLTQSTAVVGWLSTELHRGKPVSWGYVIRETGPVAWVRLDSSNLDNDGSSVVSNTRELRKALHAAASWRERVMDADEIKVQAAEVWDCWGAPLLRHLERVHYLVVIPSGPMLGLPIEALIDSAGAYLGDRYVISYVPSATIYAWLQEQTGAGEELHNQPSLLLGDPPFTEAHLTEMQRQESVKLLSTQSQPFPKAVTLRGALAGDSEALAMLPRLPWTRGEVEQAASVLPQALTLLGAEASEQQLVRLAESGEMRDFRVIHLATHALVDDEAPERSALILSRVGLPDPFEAAKDGRRIFDGLLTAKEIVREWDLDADLVTLSGCQTGLGQEIMGEGYIGLAHAFLQAGAHSLLVSLWRVEDEATALLMARFYGNLIGKYDDGRLDNQREPMPKAEALQEAKHWLRSYIDAEGHQVFQHPVYWSGFVLIGDPG